LSRNTLVRAIESAGHEVGSEGELMIVAGGDGTVTRVARQLVGTDRCLAIVPLGTANNLARSLGHSAQEDGSLLEVLLDTLSAGEERSFDVGVALGSWGRTYFYESAGVGLFADALDKLFTDEDKEPCRAAGALAAFLEKHQPRHFQLSLDGVDVSGRYTMIEILNVAMFGPNLRLSPDADPTDGRFDVVMVSAEETGALHSYLTAIAAGRRATPPVLDIHRVRHVHLGLAGQLLRLDGELRPLGRRREQRADLRVMQCALRVRVPPGSFAPRRRRRLAPR